MELGDNRRTLLGDAEVDGSVEVIVTASDAVNCEYLGLTDVRSTISTVPFDTAGRAPIPVLKVNLMDLLLSNWSGRISYRVGGTTGLVVVIMSSSGLELPVG